jgi:putative membrane protein
MKDLLRPLPLFWTSLFSAALLWSGIGPKDYPTWLLEVLPALIAAVVLLATRQAFPLTPLLYFLVLVHAVILMVGGHYTYAEVPLFDWIGQIFGWTRNNYDKLGHFAQGFVPAIAARELFLRLNVVNGAWWRASLIVCVCLAISAVYELIEWLVAVLSAEAAEAFLGTQGYEWDTQSDMLFAWIGAVTALVMLPRLHDRQLAALAERRPS